MENYKRRLDLFSFLRITERGFDFNPKTRKRLSDQEQKDTPVTRTEASTAPVGRIKDIVLTTRMRKH